MSESEVKLGNPAVVGLAGFGLTTFVLQMHNLGYCGLAPVIRLGLCFGGTAQLVAGLMEFKKNNNFGAFWISLCLMLLFGKNAELVQSYPLLKFSEVDLGMYLVAWTIFTVPLFIASMRHHSALALTFFTLLLGFIGLDLKELTGNAAAGTFAAYDLLVCASLALYLMTVSIFAESGIKLPVGKPWF